jgi:hypothetical protein
MLTGMQENHRYYSSITDARYLNPVYILDLKSDERPSLRFMLTLSEAHNPADPISLQQSNKSSQEFYDAKQFPSL